MIIIILMMILFAFIMNSCLYEKIMTIDNYVVKIVDNLVNKDLTNIFKIITFIGSFYIPVLIIMCILLLIKNKWYFYILSGSYLTAGIFSYAAKIIIMRPRPLIALINIPKSFSFPSGHTLTSLIFYSMLCYLITIKSNKKVKLLCSILFSILIVLVGMSRIYLGVHYFSDVIGAVLIGIPLLLMLSNIVEKHFKEKVV